MNKEEFVRTIKLIARNNAIKGSLERIENPPGHKGLTRYIELSKWFKLLSDDDRTMVKRAMADAVELSVFNVLCMLDGVCAIDDLRNHGKFELYYVRQEERTLLNGWEGEFLHDIFKRLDQQDDSVSSGNGS